MTQQFVPGVGPVIPTADQNIALIVLLITSDQFVPSNRVVVATDIPSRETRTVTLPPYPISGDWIVIKDGTGTVGIDTEIDVNANGKLIDGSSDPFVFSRAYEALTLIFNGTEWNIISNYKSLPF